MLTKKNLLWSKGYLDDDYSRVATETPSDEDTIINIMKTSGDVIFIRTGSGKRICDVDHFANNLDKLSKPCILITLDGDRDIPSSYDKSVYSNFQRVCHPSISYHRRACIFYPDLSRCQCHSRMVFRKQESERRL